jgi:hypothetical protein
MPDNLPAEFDEDASCFFKDCTPHSVCSDNDSLFSYCNTDIDALSEQLGIPWESSKTIPFSEVIPFLGFFWDLSNKTIEIAEEKKNKYKDAIKEWLSCDTHSLDDIQKLHSKLLHASLVATAGCAYITSLETMLGILTMNPFALHHPPWDTSDDLRWWLSTLSSLAQSLVRVSSKTVGLSQMPALGLALALLSQAVGELGGSSKVGTLKEETLGGPRQLALSSLSILSL